MAGLALKEQKPREEIKAGESYRFDVAHYRQLAGIIDERVELIAGRIVRMTPIGGDHGYGVGKINKAFASLWDKAFLWAQSPIRLDDMSEPQPDLALIHNHAIEPGKIPPASAVALVVEVADTSLAYDRDVKGPLYATAGISEYWLLDISGRCLFVYTEPTEQGYKTQRTFTSRERVAPVAFPDCTVHVADLFRPIKS